MVNTRHLASIRRAQLAIIVLLSVLLFSFSTARPAEAAPATTPASNIILFIGDGMGPEHVIAGGMFANGAVGTLAFESFPYQTTMTHYNATGGTTDSAASSTAMATGQKVNNGVISVLLPGDGRELTTQLEIYKALGKSTGLVSTSFITDATPAGFGAHETSRNNRAAIFNDYINQTQPTVFLGGGSNGFDAGSAASQGYTVVSDRAALLALNTETALKVAGGFGTGEIPPEGMAGRANTLPTLPEMTAAALAVLDNDPDGFFLLVEHEGSDNYSHANNTEGMVRSVKELSDAVQTAVAWQAAHPDTLILVTADHETGDLDVTETNPAAGSVPSVDWGSTGHTQTPVPVYASGVGAEQITGAQIDNTDLFGILGPNQSSSGDTVSFQQGVSPTAAYDGAHDATLAENSPYSNYGSAAVCLIDGDEPSNSGLDKSAVLYWDISAIPSGQTVNGAALTLTVSNASADQYGVYALKRPFSELQTTWMQAANGTPWAAPGAKDGLDRDLTAVGTLSAPATGQATVTLNAAGLATVQGWVDAPATNYGLIIADENQDDGIDFYCRETPTASSRPRLTISYGGAAQADLVDWIWAGGVGSSTAVVNARLKNPAAVVRLIVSEYDDLREARAFGPLVADSSNDQTVSFELSELQPGRRYHYAIEADGQVDAVHPGQFQTFAGGVLSYSFAFAGDALEGSNMPVFDAVREENPLFFLSPGDFMYSDITVDNVTLFREAFANSLSASRQSALYRSVPIAYIWDDHDYAGNNSNKNAAARPAARQAYREIVPHYPLPAGTGDAPIYQSFAVGRTYFILTDLRSERDPAGNTSDPARSMMGAAQKQWFKNELLQAHRNYQVVFWVSSVPWIAPAANNRDDWGGYNAERVEIANFIRDNSIDDLVILSADAHMIAGDDGTNSDYAGGGGAAMPVLHAAALHQNGSVKGGPYSLGTYPNPTSADGQYAVVEVQDKGEGGITVRFIGKRLPASTLNSPLATSFGEATTVLIDWSVSFDYVPPTAVSLIDIGAAPVNRPLQMILLLTLLTAASLALGARRKPKGTS